MHAFWLHPFHPSVLVNEEVGQRIVCIGDLWFNERERYFPFLKHKIVFVHLSFLTLWNHFHVWLLMAMLVNTSVLVTHFKDNACNDHAEAFTWSFASCIVLPLDIIFISHLHSPVLCIYNLLSILMWMDSAQSNMMLPCSLWSCVCVCECDNDVMIFVWVYMSCVIL